MTGRKKRPSSRRACPRIHFLCHPVMQLHGILHLRTAVRCDMQLSVTLFGRTAVRPYKKNMILNGITDHEDW